MSELDDLALRLGLKVIDAIAQRIGTPEIETVRLLDAIGSESLSEIAGHIAEEMARKRFTEG